MRVPEGLPDGSFCVLSIHRSALVVTLSGASSELLPGFGSGSIAEPVAVLSMAVPSGVAGFRWTVMATTFTSFGCRVPRLQVRWRTGLSTQPGFELTNDIHGSSVSSSVTPVAVEGPLL